MSTSTATATHHNVELRYATASEVVRAALRLLMEREDARTGVASSTAKDTLDHE